MQKAFGKVLGQQLPRPVESTLQKLLLLDRLEELSAQAPGFLPLAARIPSGSRGDFKRRHGAHSIERRRRGGGKSSIRID